MDDPEDYLPEDEEEDEDLSVPDFSQISYDPMLMVENQLENLRILMERQDKNIEDQKAFCKMSTGLMYPDDDQFRKDEDKKRNEEFDTEADLLYTLIEIQRIRIHAVAIIEAARMLKDSLI